MPFAVLRPSSVLLEMEDVAYPNSAEGYTLVELIGKGMFNNEVWRATVASRNNEEVAVKIIDLEEYSQDNLESIRVRIYLISLEFLRSSESVGNKSCFLFVA
jgi:hypothetical protein